MDKVSIIIPAFNTALFLPRCLDSCINQSFKNIEIVVVLDGCTDNSFEVVKSFRERDERVVIINKENEGLPRTRRVGFEKSTGNYIFHLDSDDYIELNTIEILLSTLQREQADIVVNWTTYEDRKGNFITKWESNVSGVNKEDYLKDIFCSRLQPNIWGRLIKREIFQPVIVPSEFNCGEDYLANIMMICQAPKIKIIIEPTFLYHYIVYNESLTNTWPAEVFMPYTDYIESILINCDLEDSVIKEWAFYRIIKSWRYYLRRGGKKYLNDKNYVKRFYEKYYPYVREQIGFIERLEINLYKYSQLCGYNFSRVYSKLRKINKHFEKSFLIFNLL